MIENKIISSYKIKLVGQGILDKGIVMKAETKQYLSEVAKEFLINLIRESKNFTLDDHKVQIRKKDVDRCLDSLSLFTKIMPKPKTRDDV